MKSLALTAVAGVLMCASAAGAKEVALTWSTYLRVGPGPGFLALDEIFHDEKVDLGPCAAGWCRVTVKGRTGYIDADAVTLQRLPTAVGPGQTFGECVVSGQYGYDHPQRTQFCTLKPK